MTRMRRVVTLARGLARSSPLGSLRRLRSLSRSRVESDLCSILIGEVEYPLTLALALVEILSALELELERQCPWLWPCAFVRDPIPVPVPVADVGPPTVPK